MKIYLDADFFLAILKPSDWLKKSAISYWRDNAGKHEFSTSSLTLMEIWFYLNRAGLNGEVPAALGDVILMGVQVLPVSSDDLLGAARKFQDTRLTPMDALHAHMALRFDAIVSTDSAFDSVKGLKRIDFSKG
ncbi:type II toxin-antitoxin system VapC family toxin [Candidatus Micrarchaeota archaeon]|nr:type II toxin-antitoxin system VapC family toxin [Candidatus Micrarchaeota archaeon]